MSRILVVDDEAGIRELLSEILTDEGYTVQVAENAAAAQLAYAQEAPDLVLLDIWMPDTDGVSLLKMWKNQGQLTMPVVMMSGHATIDTAVEATRIGAVDFLEKPIALQKLLNTVRQALRHAALSHKSALSLSALARSGPIRDFIQQLDQLSRANRVIFLQSIHGSLAELCARSILTPQRPWVDLGKSVSPVNQAQLEQWQGGLLFCGDISLLSKMQQMNLAFLLERADKFDLSLVIASQRLPATLELGWDAAQIRRLDETRVDLPGLADCQSDLPEIAAFLLMDLVERREVPPHRWSVGALNHLRQAHWPQGGEGWKSLQALARNLALSCSEEEIQAQEVQRIQSFSPEEAPKDAVGPTLQMWLKQPLREARDAFERCYFETLLKQEHGNMTRVAELSGLERTHLYRKLKQLGVSVPRQTKGKI